MTTTERNEGATTPDPAGGVSPKGSAGSTSDTLRVALIAEQLLQEVPGGIGTYVRALLRRVPAEGVELEPVVARHRSSTLSRSGLPHARTLRLPRAALYRRWAGGGGPKAAGSAALVHAPSLAFPPREGRPLVVTAHDVLFLEHPEWFTPAGVAFHTRMVERLSEADVVIAPSRTTADAIAQLEHPPGDVRVIPMGTDLEAPPPDERARLLEAARVEKPYVLWMGTLEPRKNPEGVVRGFVYAIDAGIPDANELKLYLVGPPGWWSGDLRAMIEDRGLADRVRRIDEQPLPVRAALYAEARTFVFPSLAEGFGLPVLEAMACGAPVVTSNRSSLPEVAGSAAQLCDPTDYESIGWALQKVLRDEDLAADLRRIGLRRAKEYTWDRTVQATVALYREVLAGAST